VIGVDDGAVVTTEGRFSAPIVVDCSGWRRAVVNSGTTATAAGGQFSFGLETHTDLSGEGLHLWLDRGLIPRGLGWVFPVGKGSLIGLGSYVGLSKLKPALERFLRDCGTVGTTYHGTYFPNRLFRPTVGRLFAVGDAAGQCLPLTAEGIRPALYFGVQCGRIVQQILDGRLGLQEGLDRYRAIVDGYRVPYRILRVAQWMAEHTPTRWFVTLAQAAARQPMLPRWWPRYGWFGRFDPDPLVTGTGAA
jgi:flavin-dependent dehydrogenase